MDIVFFFLVRNAHSTETVHVATVDGLEVRPFRVPFEHRHHVPNPLSLCFSLNKIFLSIFNLAVRNEQPYRVTRMLATATY